MPISTVMLIYEIEDNKYMIELKTLCCGHNWIWVFAFSRIDREASCSSHYSSLFPRGKNLGVEVLRDPKKSFSLVSPFSYLYERVKLFCLPITAIMMTLPVIMTFSFFCIFFLSCCLVFGMGCLTSDFELIGGVAVVEMSCLSSAELRSPFTQLGLHICLLSSSRLGKRPLLTPAISCLGSFTPGSFIWAPRT